MEGQRQAYWRMLGGRIGSNMWSAPKKRTFVVR
jgi:hypothetical protein